MRRKIISFVLALTLAAGMGIAAYAAEPDGSLTSGSWPTTSEESGSNKADIQVGAKYRPDTPTYVCSVRVTWPEMTFKFGFTMPKQWDHETHTYYVDPDTRYDWTTDTLSIDVANRSNFDVDVSGEYTSESDNKGIAVTLQRSEFRLDSAAIMKQEDVDTFTLRAKEIRKTPDLSDLESKIEDVKIGTFKITVTKSGT